MQQFSISSTDFNRLQKRLLSLPTGDKASVVSFITEKNKVKIFYNGKVDKGETSSLFYEELEALTSSDTKAISSCLITNFSTIKIPDNTSEDKFPNCKEVSFSFTDSVMTVSCSVKWNKHTAANLNKLNFALIPSPSDLSQYDSLFSENKLDKIKISTKVLLESIQQIGFIKSDATSKEGNGCYFDFNSDRFYAVSTDSSMAVRYKGELLSPISKNLNFTVTNTSLNNIRTFVLDTEECEVSTSSASVYVHTSGRKMLVPRLAGKFLISDHEKFFDLKDLQYVACLDLKPLVFNLNSLNPKSNDIYKRTTLNFKESRFDLETQADQAHNIPCQVSADSTINVNGDFLSLACQRLLTLDIFSKLHFDKSTDKIAVSTDETDKLTFLIQGLSF